PLGSPKPYGGGFILAFFGVLWPKRKRLNGVEGKTLDVNGWAPVGLLGFFELENNVRIWRKLLDFLRQHLFATHLNLNRQRRTYRGAMRNLSANQPCRPAAVS